MKSYTDLEQSKKLAEILPIETADMRYDEYISYIDGTPKVGYKKGVIDGIPCWSLTALLCVLPDEVGDNHYLTLNKEGKEYCCCYEDNNGNSFRHTFADNLVDACVEMIIKLHEQNLL